MRQLLSHLQDTIQERKVDKQIHFTSPETFAIHVLPSKLIMLNFLHLKETCLGVDSSDPF